MKLGEEEDHRKLTGHTDYGDAAFTLEGGMLQGSRICHDCVAEQKAYDAKQPKLICDSCNDEITIGAVFHYTDGDFYICDKDMLYKSPEEKSHSIAIVDGKVVE